MGHCSVSVMTYSPAELVLHAVQQLPSCIERRLSTTYPAFLHVVQLCTHTLRFVACIVMMSACCCAAAVVNQVLEPLELINSSCLCNLVPHSHSELCHQLPLL